MKDATAMRPVKILGTHYLPGDKVPGDVLAQMNPTVLEANYSQKNIGDPDGSGADVHFDEAMVRKILAEAHEEQQNQFLELGAQLETGLQKSLSNMMEKALANSQHTAPTPKRGRPPGSKNKGAN